MTSNKIKSRTTVQIYVHGEKPGQTALKEFTFLYMPYSTLFDTNALQTVRSWRSANGTTFVCVKSTDLVPEAKRTTTMYSGRVHSGSRMFLEPNLRFAEYVLALFKLGAITQEQHEYHAQLVKEAHIVDTRVEARLRFLAECDLVGIDLNRTQLLKVDKHFDNLPVSLSEL